jgi:hypothetical protein
MREPTLDIHQAEGGADAYWRRTCASFEGACPGVERWRFSCAAPGHGATFVGFLAPAPKRAKNQGLSYDMESRIA